MASINNMFVVKYRKIWFTVSGILLAASLFAIIFYGFNFSIDFKGGTITEAAYISRPEKSAVESRIEALSLGGFSVRPSGENNYVVRTRELGTSERVALEEALEADS